MTDTKIQISVLFFASLRDQTQERNIKIVIDMGSTVKDLLAELVNRYPKLEKSLSYALCAVNREYVESGYAFKDGDEVSFFPPVSGGKNSDDTAVVTDEHLDANAILQELTSSTGGAACIFTGFVRKDTKRGQDHITEKLEYEAYIPMAEQKMLQICNEIRQKWPKILKIYMVQRIGILLPGDVTTVIGCSSAHRDEGIFEAARYGIDRMKEIVPVWKKEVGPEGSEWVIGRYKPSAGE